MFLAGEHCDHETMEWIRERFQVPGLDNWWQTGIKRIMCMYSHSVQNFKCISENVSLRDHTREVIKFTFWIGTKIKCSFLTVLTIKTIDK